VDLHAVAFAGGSWMAFALETPLHRSEVAISSPTTNELTIAKLGNAKMPLIVIERSGLLA